MIRTDLAAEAAAYIKERSPDDTSLSGIRQTEYTRRGIAVTRVEIETAAAAAALGKPCGRYLTLELDPLLRREPRSFSAACHAIAEELRPLLPAQQTALVLVAGIGNTAITPDALGPDTVRHLLVTRHMIARMPQQFGGFRPVAAVCPGVLGETGVETVELLRGVAERVQPDAMIVVDALAARRMDRLCRTVQIADTGLAPGSGLGGDSLPINRETFGIPVIAVGMPTVVDSLTLTIDTLEDAGYPVPEEDPLRRAAASMIITPKDIDTQVADAAKLLGYAITLALQPGLTMEDVELFLS